MTWTVIYHHDVEEDLSRLGPAMASRVVKAIDSKLTRAPLDFGVPLSGNLADFRKLRVGDCRVVFRVFQKQVQVYVLTVGPKETRKFTGWPDCRTVGRSDGGTVGR